MAGRPWGNRSRPTGAQGTEGVVARLKENSDAGDGERPGSQHQHKANAEEQAGLDAGQTVTAAPILNGHRTAPAISADGAPGSSPRR